MGLDADHPGSGINRGRSVCVDSVDSAEFFSGNRAWHFEGYLNQKLVDLREKRFAYSEADYFSAWHIVPTGGRCQALIDVYPWLIIFQVKRKRQLNSK